MIEFCLPFAELNHLVAGLTDQENSIKIDYPVEDCQLQVRIPEESKGVSDKVKNETKIVLQTYVA